MDIVRFSAPRAGRVFAALGVLTASVASAAIPALVSADTITTRQITLSSSAKSNASTSYRVQFKTSATASSTGAFVIDFCTTSAVNTSCSDAGVSTTNVGVDGDSTDDATATNINSAKAVKVVLDTPAVASSNVDVTLTGITNPGTTGVFYARIVTYIDGDSATPGPGNYTYTSPSSVGTHLDDGSVALDITDGFSVNGAVLESLTFCASGVDGTAPTGCSDTGHLVPPNIKLGTDGVLETTAGTDGDVLTFIATNASGGAVVNLKSDAAGCGGLYRDNVPNSTNCGIGPIGGGTAAAALTSGAAKFGAKLTLTQPTGGGALAAVADTDWNDTTYNMPYASNGESGVTSVYGAPVYDTAGLPTNEGTGKLSFNANRSNLTPAGNYSAKFSLIATGKF